TSIVKADTSTNPIAGEHSGTETALRMSAGPYRRPQTSLYTENYTERLEQYLETGEILGAAGSGRVSAAPRSDFALATAAALLSDDEDNVVYELGGPAFSFEELAATISEVTGKTVGYRN